MIFNFLLYALMLCGLCVAWRGHVNWSKAAGVNPLPPLTARCYRYFRREAFLRKKRRAEKRRERNVRRALKRLHQQALSTQEAKGSKIKTMS